MKIKIAHCADIHLKSKIKTKNHDVKETFSHMLKLCKSEKVDFLLICGDLFDDVDIDKNTLDWVKNEFKIFERETIISPGNHDPFTPDSPYSSENWPKNVHIFRETNLTYFDFPQIKTRIWGAAFTSIYQTKSLMKLPDEIDPNYLNICLMHGRVISSNDTDEYYNPINISSLEKSKFDYFALGHIHKRSEILKVNNTYYSYPGSICGSGFGELGEKGIYLGDISREACDLNFKNICKHTYEKIKVDITDISNEKGIADKILEDIKINFGKDFDQKYYEITLIGEMDEDFSPDFDFIKLTLGNHLYFVTLKDETEVKIDPERFKYRNDFKGIFIKEALKLIESSKTEEEKNINKTALKLGIRAFEEDIIYNDN